MRGEALSPGVRDFISTHVESVRQLEVLLLLRERGGEPVTAALVAAALRVSPVWAGAQLEGLVSQGLAASGDNGPVPAYRYAAVPSQEAVVAELADAYRRRKSSVVRAVLAAMGS